MVKTPKLYFYDTGLLNYLLGIRTIADLEENRLKGQIFENMILAEFQKQNHHLYLHRDHYFWQDNNAHEVDLLTKESQGFSIFEIKATQTVNSDLFKQLDHFEKISGSLNVNKTLVYGGTENEKRTHYQVLEWRNIN